MSAFLPAPLLPYRRPPLRNQQVRACGLPEPSPMSLDTLSGFESFCWRAQDWLCTAAADADGLGTFQPVPTTFHTSPHPSSRRARHRVMRGGRFFHTAVVAVWSSSSPLSTPRYRRRLTTELDRRTATVEFAKDAVGVSVKLSPRDPRAPALRADAHYFQIGGGTVSWWFSGTADISMGPEADPDTFAENLGPFLETWDKLRMRHRAPPGQLTRNFLQDCLTVSSEGEAAPIGGLDRVSAFGFITEVVDALLPAYLPLLRARKRGSRFESEMLHDWEPVWGGLGLGGTDVESRFGKEEIDTFGISGGATCESVTVRGSPLGSWRFSLAPSMFTAAGKTYATLRNDHGNINGPLTHIF